MKTFLFKSHPALLTNEEILILNAGETSHALSAISKKIADFCKSEGFDRLDGYSDWKFTCSKGIFDPPQPKDEVGSAFIVGIEDSLKKVSDNNTGTDPECYLPLASSSELSSQLSPEFYLEKQGDEDSLSYYSQFFKNVRKATDAAEKLAQKEKHLADQAFKTRDLDSILLHSKKEIEMYPIANVNGTRVRIGPDSAPESESGGYFAKRLLSEIEGLNVQDGFITLHKVVKNTQLCSIANLGLSSKFGGIGGLSEMVAAQELTKSDRGRMFFGSAPDESGFFSKHYDRNSSSLLVRIPKSETIALNLSPTDILKEWTTVGVIPKERIYVLTDLPIRSEVSPLNSPQIVTVGGRNYIPLSTLDCSKAVGSNSKNFFEISDYLKIKPLNQESASSGYEILENLLKLKTGEVHAGSIEKDIASLFNNPDVRVRKGVAVAMGALRPQNIELHAHLTEALSDPSPDVRGLAAMSLGDIGSKDSKTHEKLSLLLTDSSSLVRSTAVSSLASIQSYNSTESKAMAFPKEIEARRALAQFDHVEIVRKEATAASFIQSEKVLKPPQLMNAHFFKTEIRSISKFPPPPSAPYHFVDPSLLEGELSSVREQINSNLPITTPLIEAVRFGTPKTVRDVIASGADVTQDDMHGTDAFHYALYRHNHEIILELLKSGKVPKKDVLEEVQYLKEFTEQFPRQDPSTKQIMKDLIILLETYLKTS